MTYDETLMILGILKEAYRAFYKDISQNEVKNTAKLWSTMFADEPVQIVTEAVKALICTLKYPPTIADVKERIAMITQPQEMTEMEAWQKVKSAISYYNADENFANLPPVLQKLVGSPNALREWALMDSETVNSVIQSNFMRSYKVITTREKEISMLPESTKQLIMKTANRMLFTNSVEGTE